jgi:hemoglobin
MKLTHIGMRISISDWELFLGHPTATLEKFNVPERERHEVFAFVESTKADIVEIE